MKPVSSHFQIFYLALFTGTITGSTYWIVEMRTLLLLTVLSCWLSVLLASGLRAEDLREVDNEAVEEQGDEHDVEKDEDDDTDFTERDPSFELSLMGVPTPRNSFRYTYKSHDWNRFPRFAVISGKTFQLDK